MTDSDWLDELYRTSFEELVLVVFALTRDVGEAEDIVQEAFALACGRRSRFDRLDNPMAWLRTVALNLARRRWRRRQFLNRLLRRARVEPALPADLVTEHADVHAAIHRLPHDQRAVVVLRYLADLPVDEVATLLHLPVGTVKSRLSRARAALSRHLSEPAPSAPVAKESDHA